MEEIKNSVKQKKRKRDFKKKLKKFFFFFFFFFRVESSQSLFNGLNTLRNQHDIQNTYHVEVYCLTFGKPLSMATHSGFFFF